MMLLLQGQASDVQLTQCEFFEGRLEFFKVITQIYPEAFNWSSVSISDQDFLLKGQMLDNQHWLLRRFVQRSSLLEEKNWEALRRFNFSNVEFLDLPSFIGKTKFGAKAMRVVESKNDVEHENGKQSKSSDFIAQSVMSEALKPFIDCGRTYIHYVTKELTKHSTFKSDLLMEMANSDYSTFFVLPSLQANHC